ncbi:FG-GAP-like repeat-containing protein [Paenibacillus mucilaginosus]|uniref:FG-GAP-like repeat-containing protein n=1 Tax=Paenibacillus mucilaginosus TaxID=61624 RepID=UPI001EF0BB35|nr:FG-GAP-like repeat-containing protein [Paenibacillus mucilaginosus]MCG7215714.1 FG-GAP-like repeat-containing protein [Paenibacillus mucilaginosus]WDM29345.1 VCBS repeat-containing protein [Paenibacillus mucilaginosus]
MTYSTGYYPASAASGDFNGDGHEDITVANLGDHSVSVLLGDGTGRFTTLDHDTPVQSPRAISVGDLNEDGKLDVVTTNVQNTVSVLLGDGEGGLALPDDYSTAGSPRYTAIGDFNGDGHQDLAVASESGHISVMLGQGNGQFGGRTDYHAGAVGRSVVAGNFTGDANLDLAVTNSYSNDVTILTGTGTGAFVLSDFYFADIHPMIMTTADFNRDGLADLAAASLNGTVSVLLANGSGGFGFRTHYAAGAGAYSVAAGDFNGDGLTDLAAANSTSNTISVLIGDGTGRFHPKVDYAAGSVPETLIAGDFNEDGKTDLAAGNVRSDSLSILLSRSDAKLSSLSVPQGTLTPSFSPKTMSGYTVNVENSVDSITVTPTTADPTAAAVVSANGTPAVPGAAIPLRVGTNTIEVEVTAADGTTTRKYTIMVIRAVEVDRVTPSIGPSAGGQEVEITGKGFAKASGVKFGTVAARTFVVNSDSSITATAPAAEQGSVTGAVYVTVTAGGTDSAPGKGSIYTYDGTLPTISEVSPADGSTVETSSPVITASLHDADSGIDPASITVRLEDTTLEHNYNAETGTVTASTYSLSEGRHDLTIDVTDLAGNAAASWSSSFLVDTGQTTEEPDTASPVIQSVTPANGEVVTTARPAISAALADIGSGIDPASIVVRLDNTALRHNYHAETGTVTASTYSLSDGRHDLTIDVTDLAGNAAASWSSSFIVDTGQTTEEPDTTSPVIQSVTPANGEVATTASPTISAVLADIGSGIDPASIVVRLDNTALRHNYHAETGTVTASTYSLSDGRHDLTIDVTDLAGNAAASWSSSFTVHVPDSGSDSDSDSDSSSGHSSGGYSSEPAAPAAYSLSVKELNERIAESGASSVVRIDLGNHGQILLPPSAGSELARAQKRLLIQSKGSSVELPSSVLLALADQLNKEALAASQIRIALQPDSSAVIEEAVKAAGRASGAAIRPMGAVTEFTLTIEPKDGDTRGLNSFPEPVILRLPLPSQGAAVELLGIYHLDESGGKWNYAGGKPDVPNGTLEAALTHNSKYAVLEYSKSYTDVTAQHWAYDTIRVLSAKHAVQGVTASEFAPEKITTRADFVTILVRALGIPYAEDRSTPFVDLPAGEWYTGAAAAAVQAGLVQGVDETHFAPEAPITREQMAALMVRAYEYKSGKRLTAGGQLNSYHDADQVSSWAADAVNKAITAGFMQGRSEGYFDPTAEATRAETAAVIYKLLSQ